MLVNYCGVVLCQDEMVEVQKVTDQEQEEVMELAETAQERAMLVGLTTELVTDQLL